MDLRNRSCGFIYRHKLTQREISNLKCNNKQLRRGAFTILTAPDQSVFFLIKRSFLRHLRLQLRRCDADPDRGSLSGSILNQSGDGSFEVAASCEKVISSSNLQWKAHCCWGLTRAERALRSAKQKQNLTRKSYYNIVIVSDRVIDVEINLKSIESQFVLDF